MKVTSKVLVFKMSVQQYDLVEYSRNANHRSIEVRPRENFLDYILLNENGRIRFMCVCVAIGCCSPKITIQVEASWMVANLQRVLAGKLFKDPNRWNDIQIYCCGIPVPYKMNLGKVYTRYWQSQDEKLPLKYMIVSGNEQRDAYQRWKHPNINLRKKVNFQSTKQNI